MCGFSLEAAQSRPAVVADKLVSGHIRGYDGLTMSRGFHTAGDDTVAVCLRPGTELSFAEPVSYVTSPHPQPMWPFGSWNPVAHAKFATAIFRQINVDAKLAHHDALEFPDGSTVLVTQLVIGQCATVLQLPAEVEPPKSIEQRATDLRAAATAILRELEPADTRPF